MQKVANPYTLLAITGIGIARSFTDAHYIISPTAIVILVPTTSHEAFEIFSWVVLLMLTDSHDVALSLPPEPPPGI